MLSLRFDNFCVKFAIVLHKDFSTLILVIDTSVFGILVKLALFYFYTVISNDDDEILTWVTEF